MGDKRESRQSSDLRMWDSFLGLPCLKRKLSAPADIKPQGESAMKIVKCPLCGGEVPELMYPLHEATDRLVIGRMQAKFPDWKPEDGTCEPCLERFRQLQPAA